MAVSVEMHNTGDPAFLGGIFSLDTSGILTFTAVPEPASFGLLGLGALALIARRQLARKA